MKSKQRTIRFVVAGVVILGTVLYLAVSGSSDSKQYYVTIAELQKMVQDAGNKAYTRNLRVAGNVKPGSIKSFGSHADFVLLEQGRELHVSYTGTEPPPDTFFKNDAQALAMGRFGHDGVFHADQLQAKCASKYAPAKDGTAPKPASTAAVVPGAAVNSVR